MGFLVATSDGLNDRFGRPLGTDFSNVYAAGTYVLEGQATVPFDPPRQYAREQAIFGPATPFYGWHYPPFFLGLAALLATMPYWLALIAIWQGCDAAGSTSLVDPRSASLFILGTLPRAMKGYGSCSPSPSLPSSSISDRLTTASSPRRCSAAALVINSTESALILAGHSCSACSPWTSRNSAS